MSILKMESKITFWVGLVTAVSSLFERGCTIIMFNTNYDHGVTFYFMTSMFGSRL